MTRNNDTFHALSGLKSCQYFISENPCQPMFVSKCLMHVLISIIVRKLHSAFWLVFGVLTLPCYVILISFCFLILTRSKKAFMVKIWNYNGKQLGEMELDQKQRWFEDTCKEAMCRQDAYVKKSIQDMNRRGVLEGIEEHNLKMIY